MDPAQNIGDNRSGDLFRPSKRRKFYRKRNYAEGEDNAAASGSAPIASPEPITIDKLDEHNGNDAYSQQGDEPQLPIAEILRRHKATQRRIGGIEFTNLSTTPASTTPGVSDALVAREDASGEDLKLIGQRFAPQTGMVVEGTDKHMMAYVDSELAKRHHSGSDLSIYTANGQGLSSSGALPDAGLHRQPAALGKLHEIDLGPDATLRNIARTKAAQRKLEGTEPEPEIDQAAGKVFLRRDGKPWGHRRRRNSDDVKRDKLVEEVMRESRLDIYDEPDLEAAEDDQAADDRIAEQFRREFLDAVSSRKQKTTQGAKPVKGKVVDERPKGPKLGGSRSARAAMREKEEATKRR